MTPTMTDLKKIVELFAIEGEVKEIKPLGNGLINDTYKVVTEGGAPDYVLQRINNAILTGRGSAPGQHRGRDQTYS